MNKRMIFCNADVPGRAVQPTSQADEWEVIAPLPLGGAQ